MSRLQWGNVTAPDFTAAARLQESANKALDGALTGVTDFVTGLTTRQREADEQSLRIKAQSYMDNPEALRRDLASGSFYGNIKPGSLSNGFIDSLTTAADGLLTSKNTFLKDQQTKDYAALEAAANPILNQAALAESQGKPEVARALLARPEVMALRNAEYRQTILDRQTVGKNDRTERTEIQTLNEQREQAAVEAFLTQNSITDAGKEPLIRQMREEGQISDNVYNSLMRQYGTAPVTPAGAVGAAGGSTGGGGDYGGNVFDRAVYDIPTPKPLSQMTLGEVDEWGRNTAIPRTRTADYAGTSAAGAFQIVGTTMREYAPKVLGENWQNQQFTPEVQERIAKAIFEDRKASGRLGETWVGLTKIDPQRANSPGAYKNVSWEDVRGLITQSESGGNPWRTPHDTMNQSLLVQDDAANSFQSVAAGNQRFLDLQADTSDQNQVISAAMQEGGTLAGEGVTRGMVTQAYRNIEKMRPNNLTRGELADANWTPSPALIASILAESRSGSGGVPNVGRRILNYIAGSDGPVLSYDKEAAQERINRAYAATSQAGAQAGRSINQARAEAAQAQAALRAATQRVTQLEQAARGNPRLMQSREMQQARQDVLLTQAQLEAATQAIQRVITSTRTGDQVRAGNEQTQQSSRQRATEAARLLQEQRAAEQARLRGVPAGAGVLANPGGMFSSWLPAATTPAAVPQMSQSQAQATAARMAQEAAKRERDQKAASWLANRMR